MEEIITCKVKKLADMFDFEQISGDEVSAAREIVIPNTNRPGLELAGFYKHEEPKRIVIIGKKEQAFIKTLDVDTQKERFKHLMDEETPFILVTNDSECPVVLLEEAQRLNFPIFKTPEKSGEIMVEMVTYLDDYLAPRSNIHGVFMNVFGKGVLIIGDSGMGKSEVALELIQRGHALIADDRVDIRLVRDTIVGESPELLQGMLEIRGIGIIDVMQLFGVRAYLESDIIDFVVELNKWDDNKEYMRAGIEEQEYYHALGVDIPRLVFPVKEGRNLAVLIEAAVGDFMLKQRGIYSSKIFDERVMDFIRNQNKENIE